MANPTGTSLKTGDCYPQQTSLCQLAQGTPSPALATCFISAKQRGVTHFKWKLCAPPQPSEENGCPSPLTFLTSSRLESERGVFGSAGENCTWDLLSQPALLVITSPKSCQERFVCLHPWSFSRPKETEPWVTWSDLPADPAWALVGLQTSWVSSNLSCPLILWNKLCFESIQKRFFGKPRHYAHYLLMGNTRLESDLVCTDACLG